MFHWCIVWYFCEEADALLNPSVGAGSESLQAEQELLSAREFDLEPGLDFFLAGGAQASGNFELRAELPEPGTHQTEMPAIIPTRAANEVVAEPFNSFARAQRSVQSLCRKLCCPTAG